MLVMGQTWLASDFMARGVLPYHGQQPLELAILFVFAILFAWISAGFWTALAGFATLALGRDRIRHHTNHPSRRTGKRHPRRRAHGRRNADLQRRRGARFRGPARNLRIARGHRCGVTGSIFSSCRTRGNADTRVEELAAWIELCRAGERIRARLLSLA